MRFCILGPLEVSGEDGTISLSGKRRRALLIRLLVSANTPVDAGRLCDDVWDGDPPAGVASTLHSHLSHLRGLLGAGRIRGAGGTVTLTVGDDELDAACYERELRGAAECLRIGDPAGAVEAASQALRRWRGPAMADVAGSVWALPEQRRLEELRAQALETVLDARLELGEHHEAIALAEQVLIEHPFREHVAAQMMLALYRSGRQRDALAVFQRMRTRLDEELGIEPGAELTSMEESILLQRPHLLAAPHRATVAPGSGPAIVLPAALSAPPLSGVVGRAHELDVIAHAAKQVDAGEGRRVVLVSGEAGIGKTTLVSEAARAAFDGGALVLFGHCEEDLATPYQLFSEALGHYVAHAPTEALQRMADQHGTDLSILVPGLGPRLGDLPPSTATDAEAERYLLFAAVVRWLAGMSAERTVVLVLDDLQWADKSSLQLLRHLTGSTQTMNLLVLGTYRDRELSHAHPFLDTLAALHRQAGVSRIELGGFDDNGVVSYMEAVSGHTLDDAGIRLAHAVFRETDGNPFFVSELLQHLSETGAMYEDASGWWVSEGALGPAALPDSVRVVIGARVGRLGPDAARALSLAAVAGRDFELAVIAHASGIDEDQLLDYLDKAQAASLVREVPGTPGAYSFTHALIQHTLVEDLGPTRRARAHRRLAEALEDLYGDRPGKRIGELARHWAAATQPTDLMKAVHYAKAAGEAALAALAPGDAQRYFAQAEDLLLHTDEPDPALAVDLAIGLGTAQRQAGDPAARDTLTRAARLAADLGDTDRLVAAALANDRGSGAGTIDVEKVEILELALSQVPPDHVDRALLLATLCQDLVFGSPIERCREMAEEALAIARASGDERIILRVLNRGSFIAPQMFPDSLHRTAEALELAQRQGDPTLLFWAGARRVGAAFAVGDIEEVDRVLELCGEIARRLDQPTLTWAHLVDLSVRALLAGEPDRAEAMAVEGLQIATESREPNAELWFGGQLMTISWQRGTLGDLIPVIEQATTDFPGFPVFTAVLAHAHAERGDAAGARALLAGVAEGGFEPPTDGLWLTGLMSYSEAIVQCRLVEFATSVFDLLEPYPDRVSAMDSTVAGPVAHALGGLATLLGRYDEAEQYFARAVDFDDRVGAKFFGASSRLEWGRMLAERDAPGDAERARQLLQAARDTAAAHGYGNVERRAGAALATLGG